MREVLDLLHFVSVNGRADQLYGPCPLHPTDERSRCFSVNLKTARFTVTDAGGAATNWSFGQQPAT